VHCTELLGCRSTASRIPGRPGHLGAGTVSDVEEFLIYLIKTSSPNHCVVRFKSLQQFVGGWSPTSGSRPTGWQDFAQRGAQTKPVPDGTRLQTANVSARPEADDLPPDWRTAEEARHLGIRASTVRIYVSRVDMPPLDRRMGQRVNLWKPQTIIRWNARRSPRFERGPPSPGLSVRIPASPLS
jgi:hypothetical protein